MNLPTVLMHDDMKFVLKRPKYEREEDHEYLSTDAKLPYRIQVLSESFYGRTQFGVWFDVGDGFMDLGTAPTLTAACAIIQKHRKRTELAH